MLLAAPGRLSTTTAWPSASLSFWLMVRATTSVAPPGVNPTTMRTGFDGNALRVEGGCHAHRKQHHEARPEAHLSDFGASCIAAPAHRSVAACIPAKRPNTAPFSTEVAPT